MSSDWKLRVGIVGCGDIGWQNAFSVNQATQARVLCVFDPNLAIAQELARQLGVGACESYEALLARKDVDAVFLSVPNHLHASCATQGAEAGKHVILEKPLANTIQEAELIVAACRKAAVKLSVNYSFRYSSGISRARGLIAHGILGELVGVSVQYLVHKGIAYWSGGYFGRTPDGWRASKEKAGGGVLIQTLVHSIDYIQVLAGDRITKVYTEHTTRGMSAEVEDTVSLVCRFACGAVGNWSASTAYPGIPLNDERLWGTIGSMTIKPDPAGFFLRKRCGSWAPGRFHKLKTAGEINHRSVFVDRFAEAVRSGSEPEINWRDGWHITALVEAAYESQRRGQAVDVAAVPS